MEEIRTSEVLEQEIREDARKKVNRILQNAEKEIQEVDREWKEKTEKALQEQNALFKKKMETARVELEASFPLLKMRKRLAFVESALTSAIDDFFSRMKEEEIIALFEKKFESVLPLLKGKKVVCYYSSLEREKAEKAIRNALPGVMSKACIEEKGYRGIILETEDKGIRIRNTVEEVKRYILDEYREELMQSLFKGCEL